MTEDEAKTMLCHRTLDQPVPRLCHGSNCMAWRWIGVRRLNDNGSTRDYITEDAARDARAKTYHNRNAGFLGCCGLAGKP